MNDQSAFGAVLRQLRLKRGLKQSELAAAAGISVDSLHSYETGRRRPSRAVVNEVGRALNPTAEEQATLLASWGEEHATSPLLGSIRKVRAQTAAMADELASYDWVALVMNERHEILGWNGLANAVAEMDLGVGLPTQFERNLLWMAAMPHFADRLTNWEGLIGGLAGTLKREGVSIDQPASVPPYLAALVRAIERHYPSALDRFFRVWVTAPPFPEGMRNVNPISWRLADGTELSFLGATRDWSMFDGTFAFDWHAADSATGQWVEDHIAVSDPIGVAPGAREYQDKGLDELLYEARREVGMSRRALAERSGISASAISKYESGQRRPRREGVLALGRAMSVDGLHMNALLQTAGYEPEPSDFARVVAGYEAAGIFAGRPAAYGLGAAAVRRELARLEWPCFLLNSRCEVEDANAPARRITHFDEWTTPRGRQGPHLLQFIASPLFRERLRNWHQLVRAIVPDMLRPLVLGYHDEKRPGDLAATISLLRHEDPQALRDLSAAWDSAPERATPRRMTVPIEWVDDGGGLLRFHCFVNAWNAYDPYWAIDWHPANQAAWAAVGPDAH